MAEQLEEKRVQGAAIRPPSPALPPTGGKGEERVQGGSGVSPRRVQGAAPGGAWGVPNNPTTSSRASRKEVRISGFGGQGVVLAGVILARAAAIYDDAQATQSQSHGAESRGGACVSDVVISGEKIDYPMCVAPEVLVAMSPESASKYVPDMRPGGVLIVDEDMVPEVPAGVYSRLLKVPATRVATEELEKRIVANMVMLGSLVAIAPVVSRGAMEKAVLASAPKGTEDLNLRALRRGFELGEAAAAQA